MGEVDNESFLMIPLPATPTTIKQPWLSYPFEGVWSDSAHSSMDFLLQPLPYKVLDYPPSVNGESRIADMDSYNPHEEATKAGRESYGHDIGRIPEAKGGQGPAQGSSHEYTCTDMFTGSCSWGMCTSIPSPLPPSRDPSRESGIPQANGLALARNELGMFDLAAVSDMPPLAGTTNVPKAFVPVQAATAELKRVLGTGKEVCIHDGDFMGRVGCIGPMIRKSDEPKYTSCHARRYTTECAKDQAPEIAAMEDLPSTQARRWGLDSWNTTEGRVDRVSGSGDGSQLPNTCVEVIDQFNKLTTIWERFVRHTQIYGQANGEFAECLRIYELDAIAVISCARFI